MFAIDLVFILPGGQTPAFSAIHRLLLEALPDFEVDFRGADSGGSFDVELVPVLADLHVGFGGGRHRHLPEHGVDTQRLEELVEILAAPHLPGAGEVRHGGAGGGDAMLLALRLGHRVSGADRGGGGERGSHPPAPGPSPGSSARRQAAVPPPSLPSVRPCSPPSIHHSLLRGPPGAARLPLVQPLRWAPRTR